MFDQTTQPLGHLMLKSSAFCPTGGKLTNQCIIVDHMVAHYRNLKNVKSCVDTSRPKTMQVSQKVRDQKKRQIILKEDDVLLRATSATGENTNRRKFLQSRSHSTNDFYADDTYDGTLMTKKFSGNNYGSTTQDFWKSGKEMGNTQRSDGNSQRFDRSLKLNQNWSPLTERNFQQRPRNPADPIETRSHLFTEGKPFTPRTLKSNRTSKITQLKYHNPPKPKSSKGQPSDRSKQDKNEPSGVDSNDQMGNQTLTDTMFNDTMRSSVENRARPSDVPPLDISLDADNIQWLKEQSSRNEVRRSRQNLASSPQLTSSTKISDNSLLTNSRSHIEKSTIKLSKSDEDLKYLDFIQDVTNDILDRGIFSNRVVNQVFESHIKKRKDELDERKMRDMIDELRCKIGIPLDRESEDMDGFGFASTMDREISTNSYTSNSKTMRPPLQKSETRKESNGSYQIGSNSRRLSNTFTLDDVEEVQEEDLNLEGGETSPGFRREHVRFNENVEDDESHLGFDENDGTDLTLTGNRDDDILLKTIKNPRANIGLMGDEVIKSHPIPQARNKRLSDIEGGRSSSSMHSPTPSNHDPVGSRRTSDAQQSVKEINLSKGLNENLNERTNHDTEDELLLDTLTLYTHSLEYTENNEDGEGREDGEGGEDGEGRTSAISEYNDDDFNDTGRSEHGEHNSDDGF